MGECIRLMRLGKTYTDLYIDWGQDIDECDECEKPWLLTEHRSPYLHI